MRSLSDAAAAVPSAVSARASAGEFDLVLERKRALRSVDLRELWHFRELLYFLTLRDVKVRYKQTALGVVWAVLQPVLAMILFTIVFEHVAKIATGGIPYPIFAYAALVPWTFFANSVQLSSTSLVITPQLITKIYFPRIFLVVSPILASFVDFLLAFVVLVGLMAYYGVTPDAAGVALLIPLLLLAFASAVGICAWLSALNVKYRDVRFVVPFLVQAWLFATPVVYSIHSLSQPWRTLYGLNPMASVVEGFRWALAGGPTPDGATVGLSVVSGAVMLVAGLVYFARTEKSFADVI